MDAPTYKLGECRKSFTGVGVLWPVLEVRGKCGCGSVEMSNAIAYFAEKSDAELFIEVKTQAAFV
jgi:hypothetical protein